MKKNPEKSSVSGSGVHSFGGFCSWQDFWQVLSPPPRPSALVPCVLGDEVPSKWSAGLGLAHGSGFEFWLSPPPRLHGDLGQVTAFLSLSVFICKMGLTRAPLRLLMVPQVWSRVRCVVW